MTNYVIGIDLGNLGDRTALSILESPLTPKPRQATSHSGWGDSFVLPEPPPPPPPVYVCNYLRLWTPGTVYKTVLDDAKNLVTLLKKEKADAPIGVALDVTVVGTAVRDDFSRDFNRLGVPVTAFVVTGGTLPIMESKPYRLPKRDLVSVLQVLLAEQRLRIGERLEHSKILRQELSMFKAEKLTDNETPDWREREHDDLVLATALACWLHERQWRESQRRPARSYEY